MNTNVKTSPTAPLDVLPLDVLPLVSGLLFPFLILRLFLHTFHYNDVGLFAQWAECWQTDAAHVYDLCQFANYPALGMAFSAGLIAALKSWFRLDEVAATVVAFRLILAAFDALNFVLLAAIAGALKIQRAFWVALMIAVLPSSWAGGAVWGQIDDISQFFLLLGLYGLVRAYQTAAADGLRSVGYFLVAVLSLVAGLLTKQLAIFSIAALAPLTVAVLIRFRSAPKLNRWLTGGCLLAGAGFFLLLDRWIDVTGFFGSSFLYVWLGGGSDHYHKIAGDGFNIWVLLDFPPGSPSDAPFARFSLFGHELRFTPLVTGLALFGGFTLLVSRQFYRFARGAAAEIFIGGCIFYLAMINLGFNVLLTGVHERYLYHFYPFLLLSAFVLASRNAFAKSWMLACFIATGILYGAYVLSCIAPELEWFKPVLQPRVLAVVHAALLAVLLALGFRSVEGAALTRPERRAPANL